MGTLEPVPDCVVVVGGELEQSLEEEGRTGAASDRVKVIDWVLPLLIRRYNKTKPHTKKTRPRLALVRPLVGWGCIT